MFLIWKALNSWASKCQVQLLTLISQIKRHSESQRKEIYYTGRDPEKRQSKHSAISQAQTGALVCLDIIERDKYLG
jgi:hypothetical protein